MANPHRGEVALESEGATYTLVFSVNACCEVEELLGQSFNQILARLDVPATARLGTIRALLWAALRERHAGLSLTEAGSILDGFARRGELALVVEKIGEAVRLAYPPAEAQDAASPRKAKGRRR